MRLLDNLRIQGITRLVVVTGYLENCVREFLDEHAADIQLDYIFNPVYKTTNNIYSLWLAKEAIEEPFVLLESDLIFEASLLESIMIADRIAISNILPWMNGSMVELNTDNSIKAFRVNHDVDDERRYKTVNICSLSPKSWKKVIARLDHYIEQGLINEYYETVFADMVTDGSLKLHAELFNENKWYEIDTVEDLHQAELMFPRTPPITLPEYISSEHETRNFLISSDNIVTPENKTILPENPATINKAKPEKTK